MNKKLAIAIAGLSMVAPVFAHRLDEYLQATIISIEKDRAQASMRLIPGVAVSAAVLASIDSNHDGVLSDTERQAYAQQVLRDLSVSVDDHPVVLRLLSADFPTIQEMKEGIGEIHIEFAWDLTTGGARRKLVFENHHQGRMSAYLVNCLVPRDRDIQVIAQNRNQNQSFYQLDYRQAGPAVQLASQWWPGLRKSLGDLGGIPSMFGLGMRHIAEGTDHILFLLTLLLPAPLLASGSRWAGFSSARRSVRQILKIVTAFTVGHSITLALAAWGVVHVSSRPIEVLIAVSILISAAHALCPLFPGREAAIAAFFGLIHGLAFAATLGQLGLGRWERVCSVLGFNLGIETMQLIVVAATLPSLLVLSRTREYTALRIGGALFAGLASVGWIAERMLDVHNSVDIVVDSFANHAILIAVLLFMASLVCLVVHELLARRSAFTGQLPRPTPEHI